MSEKKCFQSRKGGGLITAHQYITEMLCILVANQRKEELRDLFWKEPAWGKFFIQQVTAAGQLLKQWDVSIVVAALKDSRCRNIKSFRAKWFLEPILKEKKKEQDARQTISENKVVEKSITTEPPRPPSTSTQPSLLSRLRGL